MSTALSLTVSDKVVSETEASFPATVFPLLRFTDSLLPAETVLSLDQSAVEVCALAIAGEIKSATIITKLIPSLFRAMPIMLLLWVERWYDFGSQVAN
jgi:hypothetical protein